MATAGKELQPLERRQVGAFMASLHPSTADLYAQLPPAIQRRAADRMNASLAR